MPKEQGRKLVAQNKKARHDYHLEDTYEAGLVLVGTEVKSLREGRASLVDGFVDIEDHEAWLHGVHIPEYTQGTWTNHSARRKRKLLLNRVEIDKIERKVNEKGFTIIPTALYFKDGRAKVEIALAKGKKSWDKRHALAERQADREKEQASVAGSRAWTDRWFRGAGLAALTSTTGARTSRSSRPAVLAGPRPPGPLRRARALPAAADPGRGLGAVRPGRAEDRPAVADPLPRHRRGTRRAAARPRRTPLLRAALCPQARRGRVPQRLGPRRSPPTCPSRCGRRRSIPEPEAAAYVAELVADGVEVFKIHVQVGDFRLDDPLLDDVWGRLEDARHAGRACTPARVRSPTTFTGPAPLERVLRRSRGCGWWSPISARRSTPSS